ncbi:MAG: oligosaccharide flippase family protein, partial [Ferruginibacter sp.]
MQFTKALQHTIVWKALNTILIFCINLLLVRILGAESSGEFFFAVTALSFFILILSGSVESGITYYGSNDSANIASLSLLVLPWLLLQALASWLLLRFLAVKVDQQLSWLFIISNLIILYFSALYYSKKWFLSLNLSVFIVNALVLMALYWIYKSDSKKLLDHASYYELTAKIYFGGFLLTAVLLTILFFTRAKFTKPAATTSMRLAKKVFAYSGIAFVSNIIFFLVTRIDYFFVEKFCDEAALSNYVQASKMGQLFILLP